MHVWRGFTACVRMQTACGFTRIVSSNQELFETLFSAVLLNYLFNKLLLIDKQLSAFDARAVARV